MLMVCDTPGFDSGPCDMIKNTEYQTVAKPVIPPTYCFDWHFYDVCWWSQVLKKSILCYPVFFSVLVSQKDKFGHRARSCPRIHVSRAKTASFSAYIRCKFRRCKCNLLPFLHWRILLWWHQPGIHRHMTGRSHNDSLPARLWSMGHPCIR
jgi:hypothetical protein